jgi:hypothetical protein
VRRITDFSEPPLKFPDHLKEFPVKRLKFAVPSSREFADNPQAIRGFFQLSVEHPGAEIEESPEFFSMIREFDAESGSCETASSATGSSDSEILRSKC